MAPSRSFFLAVRSDALSIPATFTEPEHVLSDVAIRLIDVMCQTPRSADEIVEQVVLENGLPATRVKAELDGLMARGVILERSAAESQPLPSVTHLEAPATSPADVDAGQMVLMPVPLVVRVGDRSLEWHDHDGRLRLTLSARELAALALGLARPATLEVGHQRQAEVLGRWALERSEFNRLVARAVAARVAAVFDAANPMHSGAERLTGEYHEGIRRHLRTKAAFVAAERQQTKELRSTLEPHHPRVPVMGVNTHWTVPPLALGLLMAYARRFRDGALESTYVFLPRMLTDPTHLEQAASVAPGVFLFSDYAWTSETNLRLSRLVKQTEPRSITVHGGPEIPKYDRDLERFFQDHPDVDIAVIGEGEVTLAEALEALQESLAAGRADLDALATVPGLAYRQGDRVARTGSRDRIEDLDILPSPILEGLMDPFAAASPSTMLILETNRGCPYGCTFCDWGSATMSRIRKFDLDRVFAELTWAAENGVGTIFLADANFGIFERDVEIARHIADLKKAHGFPRYASSNYAKNTVKHLRPIIEILASADILTEGKVSLQTLDEPTLLTIRRKNIKLEKYEDLATEFHRSGLGLAVELMMGLPGSTASSFRRDLQSCIDRDVRAFTYPTVMLPNSPMNDPEYRSDHGIVATPGEQVRECKTFTRAEWDDMYQLRAVFQLCELFGVLRQVATFVRHELGVPEVEFYEQIAQAAAADRERWPTLSYTLRSGSQIMVPPSSWRLLLDEVALYLTEELHMPVGSDLETVLEVQRALLPARERTFPHVLELDHDYAAWHQAVNQARLGGRRADWQEIVPRLQTFGPAQFTVNDPLGICQFTNAMSTSAELQGGWWEFDSPASRPVSAGNLHAPSTADASPTLRDLVS